MRRLEYVMLLGIDHLSFFLGMCAPEEKDHLFALSVDTFYDDIGKTLPPPVLVSIGLSLLYSQDCVE